MFHYDAPTDNNVVFCLLFCLFVCLIVCLFVCLFGFFCVFFCFCKLIFPVTGMQLLFAYPENHWDILVGSLVFMKANISC